jgi:hypothetical protein
MQDGMTKRTTRNPRWPNKRKCMEKQSAGLFSSEAVSSYYDVGMMGSHIVGHGYYCDFFSENLRDDGNLQAAILHKNICRMQENNKARGRANPPCLFVQLDNVNHNKGISIILYCCWLVQTAVFTKIKLCYLPVGHTHEYIDQFFST